MIESKESSQGSAANYESPRVEVLEVSVEKGFAVSDTRGYVGGESDNFSWGN